MKLGGLEGTGGMPVAELPLVDTLAPLFDASRRRAVVTFEYRGTPREVEPWGLTSKHGRWYLVGEDHGAGEMRVYRADRIEGDIEPGPPDTFTVPADFRADAYLADQPWEYGPGRAVKVEVRIDAGHDAELAAQLGPEIPATRQPDGSTVVELSVVSWDGLRSFVLGYLDHAEVLSPDEARAAITDWLHAIARGTESGIDEPATARRSPSSNVCSRWCRGSPTTAASRRRRSQRASTCRSTSSSATSG